MQVRHDARTAGELHQSEPPGQPLSEKKVVAVVEHGVLLPPEVITVASRLVCGEDDSKARLVGYFRNVHVSLQAFDTLNPEVTLFACTGSTYLVGLEAEDRVFRGHNVVSAARAVLAALQALGARRITGVFDLRDPEAALRAVLRPHGGRILAITPYMLVVQGS